jgi:hypothetical protein
MFCVMLFLFIICLYVCFVVNRSKITMRYLKPNLGGKHLSSWIYMYKTSCVLDHIL